MVSGSEDKAWTVLIGAAKMRESSRPADRAEAMDMIVKATASFSLHNLEDKEYSMRRVFELHRIVSRSHMMGGLMFRSHTAHHDWHWLDLCHADGYRREAALQQLQGAAPNAFFIAIMIRRLNDWVPEVRQAVRQSLPAILAASKPVYVFEALAAILLYWYDWARIDLADKQRLLDMLDRGVLEMFKHKIIHSVSGPMPKWLSQIGRLEAFDCYLTAIAAQAVQPMVRAKAYRSLLEGKVIWAEGRYQPLGKDHRYKDYVPMLRDRPLSCDVDKVALLLQAAEDASSKVRRVAAEMLIRGFALPQDECIRLAKQFAADKSPTVAGQGRFLLDKLAVGSLI